MKETIIQVDELKGIGAPIVVVTHMRSGTHLTIDLLRKQFKECASWKLPLEQNDSLYLSIDDMISSSLDLKQKHRALKILRRAPRPVIKSHLALPGFSNLAERQSHFASKLNRDAKIIHVVRHPVSVLSSLHAWHLGFENRNVVEAKQIEGLLDAWKESTMLWLEAKNIITLRAEDILSETEATIETIEKFIGARALNKRPLLPRKLKGLSHSRMNRIFGMKPESTEIISPVKTEVASDELLSMHDKIVDYCSSELLKLGYL